MAQSGPALYIYELLNTDDPSAGIYIHRAGEKLDEFLTSDLMNALKNDRTIHKYKFDGSKFSIDSLRSVVNDIQKYSEDDIVILFYIGHGFIDSESPLQLLNIPDNANSATSYHAQKIVDALRSRQPGTLITFFEACNVDPNAGVSSGAETTIDPSRIVSLFAQKFGIASAAAKKGQFSFVSRSGGLFSSRFIDFFRRGVDSSSNAQSFEQYMSLPISTGVPSQQTQDPIVVRLW